MRGIDSRKNKLVQISCPTILAYFPISRGWPRSARQARCCSSARHATHAGAKSSCRSCAAGAGTSSVRTTRVPRRIVARARSATFSCLYAPSVASLPRDGGAVHRLPRHSARSSGTGRRRRSRGAGAVFSSPSRDQVRRGRPHHAADTPPARPCSMSRSSAVRASVTFARRIAHRASMRAPRRGQKTPHGHRASRIARLPFPRSKAPHRCAPWPIYAPSYAVLPRLHLRPLYPSKRPRAPRAPRSAAPLPSASP